MCAFHFIRRIQLISRIQSACLSTLIDKSMHDSCCKLCIVYNRHVAFNWCFAVYAWLLLHIVCSMWLISWCSCMTATPHYAAFDSYIDTWLLLQMNMQNSSGFSHSKHKSQAVLSCSLPSCSHIPISAFTSFAPQPVNYVRMFQRFLRVFLSDRYSETYLQKFRVTVQLLSLAGPPHGHGHGHGIYFSNVSWRNMITSESRQVLWMNTSLTLTQWERTEYMLWLCILSLVLSTHTSAQLCLSLYTALFDTLYSLVIAFAFWYPQSRKINPPRIERIARNA